MKLLMLPFIQAQGLFYLSSLVLAYSSNIKSISNSTDIHISIRNANHKSNNKLRESSKESNFQIINNRSIATSYLIDKNSRIRKTQETPSCDATCTDETAISLRITPVENVDSETLLNQCTLTHKPFKQRGVQKFVVKVCRGNIKKLKSQTSIIASIVGGTKTTKRSQIIPRSYTPPEKVSCNGGCCKTCQGDDKKYHEFIAAPIGNEGVNLINSCYVGDKSPEIKPLPNKNGTTVEWNLFNICKADKHIIKASQFISEYNKYNRRYRKKFTSEKCPTDKTKVTVDIQTDDFPMETTWKITQSEKKLLEGGPYSEKLKLYTNYACLDPGEYTFTITDAASDGICCEHGNGYFNLTVASELVESFGTFQGSHTKTFTIDPTS